MTTIILVIIGVLIAAAAALFMFFYGGNAYGEGATRAEAARLVSEGQQISYATDLYYKQEGSYPGLTTDAQGKPHLDGAKAIQDLKDKKYLQQSPVGAKLTNKDEWNMTYDENGMIYSKLGKFVAADPAQKDSWTADQQASDAAMNVCRQARKQLNYTDWQTVYKCDGSNYSDPAWRSAGTLPDREPCCIKG